MIVRRIVVEGGFLDGLDQSFESGLVTLIGPRGAGKTSLIELIRFTLDAGLLTGRADPYKQARAVLDSGRVTLMLEVRSGHMIEVTRSGLDAAPKGLERLDDIPPLILAQDEIEELGEHRVGQLNLIDGFRVRPSSDRPERSRLATLVRDVAEEAGRIRAEIASLRDQLAAIGDIDAAAERVRVIEAELGAGADTTRPVRARLDALNNSLTQAKTVNATRRRNLDATRDWAGDLQALIGREPLVQPIPDSRNSTDVPLLQRLTEAREALGQALSALSRGITAEEVELTQASDAETNLEAEARTARDEFERLEAGAGALSREASILRQQIAAAASLRDLIHAQAENLASKVAMRDAQLVELDRLHDERYAERGKIVETLNTHLRPKIEVMLTRSGNFEAYQSVLVDLLRGSNLRYNTIAPIIATQVAPVELASFVETGDAATLSAVTGLESERANRILGYLAGAAPKLFTTVVDDSVVLRLLDGDEYKPSDELSTGQRCTAVLPILLAEQRRGVIIDQPEDHLDNEFIVETVIKALRDRSRETQLIFSTHNANIPVLGEATQVVAMQSNGRRGYIRRSGKLEDEVIVSIITAVMEGGVEAFQRRAAFYSEHSSSV